MVDNKDVNQDFYKGIGVGILIVLSIGFLIQTYAGGSINFGNNTPKTLKTITKTADDNGSDTTSVDIPDVTSEDHIYGDVNAPITIVEYSDLECPFCKRFHKTLQDTIDANEGKVNWVYRHFPLVSLHSKSITEAQATECATEQGGNDAFWAYTNKLLETTTSNNGLDLSQLSVIADQVGLDGDKLQKCIDSGKYEEKVKSQIDDATNAGGRGTPFSVVIGPNGETVPLNGAVPASQVQAAIDSLLK